MLGRVTVVGCGLIGGSIVKGLRARGGADPLAAVDRPEVLQAARAFVDEACPAGSAEARSLVARSNLVVLAAPVGAIVHDLPWVLDGIDPGAAVTDAGSVKGAILAAARSHARTRRFLGGHPMAGRETGGFEASRADLFERARWFMVGAAASDPDVVERVTELATFLGASPVTMDAAEHDRAMAYVSHVPHVVASAIYDAAARAGVLGAAGPGFRDMTRIAGGPTNVWRDIVDLNREPMGRALHELLLPLVALRDKLLAGDQSATKAAVELLEDARRAKDALPAPPRNAER
jgi:prephenate dehydrogenase